MRVKDGMPIVAELTGVDGARVPRRARRAAGARAAAGVRPGLRGRRRARARAAGRAAAQPAVRARQPHADGGAVAAGWRLPCRSRAART